MSDVLRRAVAYALARAVLDYAAGLRNLNTPLRADQVALLDDFTHTALDHMVADVDLDLRRDHP